MDDIEELIAAGESILRDRDSTLNESAQSLKESTGSILESSINDKSIKIMVNSKQSLFKGPTFSTDISTENCFKSSNSSYSDDQYQLNHTKNSVEVKEKSFEKVVSAIREEFAQLFSTALSVNSSLINANRLVTAVLKRFCKDPAISQQLLSEVKQCEESCQKNDNAFNNLARKIHHLLAEMNNLSSIQEDQANLISQSEKRIISLRDMIADLISDTGFKDIAKQIVSPRTTLIDLVEDSHLGLTLLSGELPNHVAKYQNEILQKNHSQELQLKEELTNLQQEYDDCINCAQKDKTRFQIEIEKLGKDVTCFEYQIQLLEKESADLKINFKEELKDVESVVANLREQIVMVKQEADERVSIAAEKEHKASESEAMIQSKINSLKEQFLLKEEELQKFQFEKSAEIKSLYNNAKKLENDLMKEKSQITRVEDVRKEFIENIRKLESSLVDANNHRQSSNEEIQLLKNQSCKLKENHATDIRDIQEKVNELSSTLCDKHSEIRLRDVKIMQLQNDLQLEEQKLFVTNSESDLLRKQIERLQNRIEKLIENSPKGKHVVLLHTDGTHNPKVAPARTDIVNHESPDRDEVYHEFQKLLGQKDKEMKKLQDSLNSEILQKNNELDRLSRFVDRLENQMIDVTSALSLTNGMSEASSRVASHLQNHSSNLVDLQETSANLHKVFNRVSIENKSQTGSSSYSYLKEDLDSYRISVKKARAEASAARLELAKEKQKNSYLQIDLDSARSVIDRKDRLQFLHSSKSFDGSKSDQLTSADSISTVLGNDDISNHD